MDQTFFRKLFRRPFSTLTVSFFTSAFIVLCLNRTFWHHLADRIGLDSFAHWKMFLTTGAILILLLQAVFTLVSFRPIFKGFLATVLILSAAGSYFSEAFGVVIDKAMIHSILETNVREAGELLTLPYVLHILKYGLIPAALVALAPVRYPEKWRGLVRGANFLLIFTLALGLFMTDYKGFVLFGRQHRDLKVFLNPSPACFPVWEGMVTTVAKLRSGRTCLIY